MTKATKKSNRRLEKHLKYIGRYYAKQFEVLMATHSLDDSYVMEEVTNGDSVSNIVKEFGAYKEWLEVIADTMKESGKKVGIVFTTEERMKVVESFVTSPLFLEVLYSFDDMNNVLSPLADFLLYSELEGNTNTHKMSKEEYPILSDTQYARRTGRRGVRSFYEVSSVWMENVSADSITTNKNPTNKVLKSD